MVAHGGACAGETGLLILATLERIIQPREFNLLLDHFDQKLSDPGQPHPHAVHAMPKTQSDDFMFKNIGY